MVKNGLRPLDHIRLGENQVHLIYYLINQAD